MRTSTMLVAGAALGLLLAACANQKEPAEKAFARIESSLAEFRTDAGQYAADELKRVDESVNNLKGKIARQDYSGVMVAAPSVSSAVSSLKANVARKKAEAAEILATAQNEWDAIAASVPQLVGDLQNRMDAFARSRKLPKNFSAEDFSLAKAHLEEIKKVWTEANTEFAAGKVTDAVRKGRMLKTYAENLLRRLSA
jgi:hypothetical protein